MKTPEQKAIEAIRAYLNIDWDNPLLKEVQFEPEFTERDNIEAILNHFVPCSNIK